MKKYFFLIIVMCMFITGCGTYKLEDAISDFESSVNNSKSYKLNGIMEISSGEEIFTYNIDAYYLKEDYYKVVLVNQTNNHEQVILKNDDGLYVVTPSLNKSFKFDSVWPDNSSQAYLLKNLVNDIKGDSGCEFTKTEDGYIIKSKVNYPNNDELSYQKIYFDKDMNLLKVEVYSTDDLVKIKVTFKSINLKAKLKEDDFLLEDLIDTTENECTDCEDNTCSDNCDKNVSSLDSIIYPLYIPTNTHLKSSENVASPTGNRVILTFGGDKNFVIVEEVAKISNDFEIIPVFGDPLMLDSSIGALSSNSISWNSGNVSYYLVSSDLSQSELVSVAKSLGNSKTVISVK